MSSTLVTWRQHIGHIRCMRRALQLINDHGLLLQGAALRTWVNWSREQGDNQRIIAKAVARLRQATLVKMWIAWSGFAKDSKEKRKAIARRFIEVGSYGDAPFFLSCLL